MPSFYPRSMGRHQMPLTPPEYQSSYSAGGYGTMSYQQAPFSALPASRPKQDNIYDYADRRGHGITYQPSLPSLLYQQPAAYNGSTMSGGPAAQFYAKAAPILPLPVPARPPTYEQALTADFTFQSHQDALATQAHQTQPKADKAVGGVAVKLDYDMDMMTDFVSEMAHGMYALFTSSIRIAEIDLMQSIQPGVVQSVDPSFRKWVHQVLCATRLPSATILLSLQYLTIRMTQLSTGIQRREAQDNRQRMLIVALVLGSKFLDDNTFINRSWSEVSGIDVKILNWMEIDWFQAMDNRLHRDPSEPSGFSSWKAHWQKYEAQAKSHRRPDGLKLSPIDTSNAYKPPHTAWSEAAYPGSKPGYAAMAQPSADVMQYDTPTYTPYDPSWYARSATKNSPESAPHTGPTTPEYYGTAGANQAPWFSHEGYSRRTMFGLPPSQSSGTQPAQPHYSNQPQHASYVAGHQAPQPMSVPYMSGHVLGCTCFYCVKSPTNYFLTHHAFGQAMPVAG